MKKLLFIFIILLSISGCAIHRIHPVKPIVIENRHYILGQEIWQYEFIDATGIPFISYEKYGFYHKGDTIK